MSRLRRDDEHSDLEARLRAARPEPRADLLERLQAQAETRPTTAAPGRSRLRLGLAMGFAASFVALFAAIGGLGLAGDQSTAAATPATATADTSATATGTIPVTGGTGSGGATSAPATGAPAPSATATQDGSTPSPSTGPTAPAIGADASADPSRQLATGWHNQYLGWTIVCKKVGRFWAVLIVPRWQLSYWSSRAWTTSCFRR